MKFKHILLEDIFDTTKSKSKSTALQVQYLPRRGTQCAKLIIYNIRVIVGDVSRSVFRWLWV